MAPSPATSPRKSDIKKLREKIPTPDLIIHCASSGRGGPDAYRSIFVNGTRLLKETFPEAHLLFTSSTSVYHQTEGETVDETSPTSPERETSRLLLEAEKQVDTAARLAGLYGPNRSVILRKFLADEAVIEEDGRRILNQIHVQDAASACLFLAKGKHSGIFNVTDDHPMSQLDLLPRSSRNTSTKPSLPPESASSPTSVHGPTSPSKMQNFAISDGNPNSPTFSTLSKSRRKLQLSIPAIHNESWSFHLLSSATR